MLLSEPLVSLINIFQDEFNEILTQQSTNVRFFWSHNWVKRIRLKNKDPNTHLAMFWNFCVGWRHDTNIITCRTIYDAMKSYLTRVWDKKIRYGYITLETRFVMW